MVEGRWGYEALEAAIPPIGAEEVTEAGHLGHARDIPSSAAHAPHRISGDAGDVISMQLPSVLVDLEDVRVH